MSYVYLGFVRFFWFFNCGKNILNGSNCLISLYVIVVLMELFIFNNGMLIVKCEKKGEDFK